MFMLSDDWISRIFIRLDLTPGKDWYESSDIFSKKAAEYGVDCINLYHVVFKLAVDQTRAELQELGLDPKILGTSEKLLLTTRDALQRLKNDKKKKLKTEEEKALFEEAMAMVEEYLSKKFDWNNEKGAANSAPSKEGETSMPVVKYSNKYSPVVMMSKNTIFRGAPGTGKSYLAKAIAADIVSDGKKTKYDELSQEEKQQTAFVQFHPSYDYSDFVEGLRPVVAADGSMGFKLRPGVFKAFVEKARKEEKKNYVFIIDEINRGEISKILGELFFSIEPGYRGKKGEVKTQYHNMHDEDEGDFYIPENVYIIGTMNDIDRSVDTFDFAMRRRFRFIEIDANAHVDMLEQLGSKKDEAVRRMKALNKVIEKKLNKNYQIGAAYFLKLKLKGMDFAQLWTDHLEPLLQEYVNGAFDETDQMESFRKAYQLENETGEENHENAG
ncbi:MAG: AAA family ATPase [Oscillospiraceae bacterium]|nr:AAA family ATPase [Oscillospiraceae bacterium]